MIASTAQCFVWKFAHLFRKKRQRFVGWIENILGDRGIVWRATSYVVWLIMNTVTVSYLMNRQAPHPY